MDTERTHIAEALDAADRRARYDENAKEILADKAVISEILKRLLPEFRDMTTDRIREYIVDPFVSAVGVHPGDTNPLPEAVRSLGQEQTHQAEGKVTFDVFFPLRLPVEYDEAEVYVNLEAQNSEALPYTLEQRAVYYLARMLSSQYQRDFTGSNYQDIKKVYSIWVVTKPEAEKRNTISFIRFGQSGLAGEPPDDRSYDLAQIFIIRLGKDHSDERADRLIRMLTVLFTDMLDAENKKRLLGDEFGIPMSRKLEKELPVYSKR